MADKIGSDDNLTILAIVIVQNLKQAYAVNHTHTAWIDNGRQ